MSPAIDVLTPAGFYPLAINKRARSSFRFAMAALPSNQRRAVLTVYGFCRVIDDIADGDLPMAEKLARLAAWKEAIAAWQIGRADSLFSDLMIHDPELNPLPAAAFLTLIDGMIEDAQSPPEIHSFEDLRRYCGLVSVPVGTLYLHILKVSNDAVAPLASTLGEAVQITNILRDIKEDLARGRCDLPRAWLKDGGDNLLSDPQLATVYQRLHMAAIERYHAARVMTAALPNVTAQSGVKMIQDSYEILHKMIIDLPARDWRPPAFFQARRITRTSAVVFSAYLKRLLHQGAGKP